jgi:3-phosphoshikimate 1-carboxyvinyltransferase
MNTVVVQRSVLNGLINCPPSKSYTHRAIVVSSLSEGESLLVNPLRSRDTNATINGCKALGVEIRNKTDKIAIIGRSVFSPPDNVINVENSGTTLRFLTPMSALVHEGYTVLTGDESIRKRPMSPILLALRNLGVECYSTRFNGLAPLCVKGGGINGGNIRISGTISSQFLSGLLISGVYAKSELEIQVEGKQVSRPYIESTISTMKEFGIKVKRSKDYKFFTVRNGTYKARSFIVPGDFSSAALLLSAGAMLSDKLIISGLDFSMPQGDLHIVDILKRMGSSIRVDRNQGEIRVSKSGSFEGGEFDLSDTPDLLPVVAILSLNSRRPIRIIGISHARYKETDRVAIIGSELPKLGIDTKLEDDAIVFSNSGQLKSACLESHNDHRLFMSFVIAAMMTNKSLVSGAESVDVSFPSFLTEMKKLGGKISYLN